MAYPDLPVAPFTAAFADRGFFAHQSAALLYIADSNAGANETTRYKAGDIVEVVDDCACNLPPAAPYFIARLFGASRAILSVYFLPQYDLTDPENPVLVRRRKWAVDWTKLTQAQRDYMLANRYVELTVNQIRPTLLDKSTGVYGG